MQQVCLRRGEETDVLAGARLIYDNEIDWVDEDCADGGVVEVLDSRMRFVAKGFFNSRSKIVVRVLTFDRAEAIDADFFRRRITAAWENRRLLGFSDACRVVFGESDGLPGLQKSTHLLCRQRHAACGGNACQAVPEGACLTHGCRYDRRQERP